jgi:3-hydroxymyristoyl/3-hydroxydecanoyl-(acyl carrier protein) dehydratase
MMTRRIEVAENSRFFAGHFPGHPILPGIAHLALVAEALGNPPLAEVKTLKLRKPVGPGEVLDLVLDEGDLVKFELRRGDETVSNGVVRIGGEESPVERAGPASSSYPPHGELIPHAPPALLVRSVLEVSAEGASAIVQIPDDNPFVDSGRAHAFVGLEAGAQTAAILEALGRSQGEAGPRIGYVVAIRNARFRTPWLPAGVPLAVTVKTAGSAPPLSIYEVNLGDGLVTGMVSTYIAEGPPRT